MVGVCFCGPNMKYACACHNSSIAVCCCTATVVTKSLSRSVLLHMLISAAVLFRLCCLLYCAALPLLYCAALSLPCCVVLSLCAVLFCLCVLCMVCCVLCLCTPPGLCCCCCVWGLPHDCGMRSAASSSGVCVWVINPHLRLVLRGNCPLLNFTCTCCWVV